MSIRVILLVLSLIVFFLAALAISYEGFQISPNPRIQDISITDTLSICKQMDFILQSKSMSYENVIQFLNNNEINSYFNSKQIDVIEQCLQGQLPTLSSYLITQKIGFLEGLRNHEAKGKAEVIKIDKYSYLRLNSFEIGYDSKLGQNFAIPEFHIYLTQDDPSTPKIYLDKLKTKLSSKNYRLPDVDLDTYDTVLIIDEINKEPFAQITLEDPFYVKDILSNLADDIKTVEFPKIIYEEYDFLEGKEITKHTGFFVGLNDITAYGQVITKSVDLTSLLIFEKFSLDYDKNQYVSAAKSKNIFIPEPNLIACIIPSTSELTCGGSDKSIELGELYSNSGDNRYVLENTDLNVYDTIVIYDKTTERSFATIPLRDYGILRVSGESFLDWLQHDFIVIPLASVVLIIFPIFFDYTRSIFKILFFTMYLIINQNKLNQPLSSLSPIMHGKKISILIPAHNEEFGIEESIKSALATDYQNKEIIVIDDGSKDKTWEIANSYAEKGLIKLIHRDPSESSKAAALNHGINYATGDYVLCMDGDTKLDKNALKNAARYFDDENTVAFSGNVTILAGDGGVDNILTKLQTYEYMIAIELGRRFTSIFNMILVISGAFGIFKKDLIKNVHTFDKDTLTEDFDLTLKFRKTRGRIRFIPDSIAYTYCPATWSMWVRQRNRWAYGQFQTLTKNKDLLRKFTVKDSIAFVDMYLLDIILSMLFPIGLVVMGIIAIILFLSDTLHVLVYSLTFVMSVFLILEFITFLFATIYSRNLRFLKLSYLVPVMTFFYRPYLRMINLRGYIRAYFNKGSKW